MTSRRNALRLLATFCGALAPPLGLGLGHAASAARVRDRWVTTSDGVRLYVAEAGPVTGRPILFVPGWTMPGWIWEAQIQALAARHRVFAMDPRGQGRSDAPAAGYEPIRRGKDIADAIKTLSSTPVLVVGWSLGVLDTLAYVHTHGDRMIAGLVLVDNSVGEEPAPVAAPPSKTAPSNMPHAERMRRFVHGMFRQPKSAAWLDRLVHDCLRTPEAASKALLAYPLPRAYWKEAVYATGRPLLYVVRPRWAAQAENLVRNRPATEIEIFNDAGHALFVDEPGRFNALLDSFVRRRVWL